MEKPRLYSDLANWWPLMSPPSEYVEEAADLLPILTSQGSGETLLELGSGGGSLAYHLKNRFKLTLTDRSEQMLDVSKQVNPECEHIRGDMTTLDLGRQFDRVLIHDAIMYATAPKDVEATLATAARHCKAGGMVVAIPDCVLETFAPETTSGGHDGSDGRALRYLEWTWDPDPSDCIIETSFALVLREPDGRVRVELDRHFFGVFPRADWIGWFESAGLKPTIHVDPWSRDVFIGVNARA